MKKLQKIKALRGRLAIDDNLQALRAAEVKKMPYSPRSRYWVLGNSPHSMMSNISPWRAND